MQAGGRVDEKASVDRLEAVRGSHWLAKRAGTTPVTIPTGNKVLGWRTATGILATLEEVFDNDAGNDKQELLGRRFKSEVEQLISFAAANANWPNVGLGDVKTIAADEDDDDLSEVASTPFESVEAP